MKRNIKNKDNELYGDEETFKKKYYLEYLNKKQINQKKIN